MYIQVKCPSQSTLNNDTIFEVLTSNKKYFSDYENNPDTLQDVLIYAEGEKVPPSDNMVIKRFRLNFMYFSGGATSFATVLFYLRNCVAISGLISVEEVKATNYFPMLTSIFAAKPPKGDKS